MEKQLLCGSCNNWMYPPILQCETGEAVCGMCRSKNENCPLCHKKFTSKRDDFLETLAKLPIIVCNICKSKLMLIELKEHKCSFEISCPINKCDWKGKPDELVNHWRNKNMKLRSFKEQQFSKMQLNNNYYVNILEAHDSKFLFKSRRIDDKFFWAVQYIGLESEAKQYTYDIEILNPQQLENKLTLTSYCQSIYLENDDLFKKGVCILTPKDFLEAYLFKGETVVYDLRVNKIDILYAERQRKRVQKYLEKVKIETE